MARYASISVSRRIYDALRAAVPAMKPIVEGLIEDYLDAAELAVRWRTRLHHYRVIRIVARRALVAGMRGETAMWRAYREALQATRAKHPHWRGEYGTITHNARSRFDREVSEAYHRRLKEMGIEVEGQA